MSWTGVTNLAAGLLELATTLLDADQLFDTTDSQDFRSAFQPCPGTLRVEVWNNGKPVDGADVRCYSAGNDRGSGVAQRVGPGTYEFTLPPGSYWIRAANTGFSAEWNGSDIRKNISVRSRLKTYEMLFLKENGHNPLPPLLSRPVNVQPQPIVSAPRAVVPVAQPVLPVQLPPLPDPPQPILGADPRDFPIEIPSNLWSPGTLFLVRPGIAVELKDISEQRHLEFVMQVLAEIEKVPIGCELVREFDPQRQSPGPRFRELRQAHVTLIIEQARGIKPKLGPPHLPKLETSKLGGRRPDGGADLQVEPKVPLIRFVNPHAHKAIAGGYVVSDQGVSNHPDFLDLPPIPFARLLFHEMCHAYYDQFGCEQTMKTSPTPNMGTSNANLAFMIGGPKGGVRDPQDNVEEQLVCGLLAGKGLKYCENRFAVEADLPLRPSYKQVGLASDPDLRSFTWTREPSTTPDDVLRANGYPPIKRT